MGRRKPGVVMPKTPEPMVPDGWTPAAWVQHLRMRAGQCRETAPEMAAMMIERTIEVEASMPRAEAAAGLRVDLETGIADHLGRIGRAHKVKPETKDEELFD